MQGDDERGKVQVAEESRKSLSSLLDVYLRGCDAGDGRPRAVKLTEKLYEIAMTADEYAVRLKAMQIILDRVDGRAVEKKEVLKLTVSGVVELPARNLAGEKKDELFAEFESMAAE